MNKNKKITVDLANGSLRHINAMPVTEKPTISFTAHLQNKIAEIETELLVAKFRLGEGQKVLDAIPECPLHGKNCVPHALDWIRDAINQTVINSNNKKSKTETKALTAKQSRKGDVQYIAETYKVPMDVIRKVMRDNGKNGRYTRNRDIIFSALCELGYGIRNN